MKPIVTFADPESLVNWFKAAFAGRSEDYKPTTVSVMFPASALTTTTHLQVELETENVTDLPVLSRAQVRVTAYAGENARSDVKALASLAQGLLLAHPGSADISGVFPLIGRSDVTRDPTTGNLMCWFLVRVDLKATQLAS